jgi:DNA-binding response OmpR family regulator
LSPTHRILVVDDDNGARRLTRATLKRAGFEVFEAEDGQQAVDLARAGMPDLVLLDVSMPVKDGFSACAELRALPGGDAVPVMMMTGLDDVQSIERAFAVGATDFITKPINWPILAHRVRYMLRASAAINALHETQSPMSPMRCALDRRSASATWATGSGRSRPTASCLPGRPGASSGWTSSAAR